MADNIRLEVVTPEKIVVSEAAQIVMSPGSEGEFGVLDGHTPFLTTLKTGMIRYKDSTGAERAVFVSGGFAEALPDRVTVLAESAERRKDINVDRAKAALARAEDRIGKSLSDNEIDVVRAKAALLRAMTRLSVVQTR